MFNPIGLKTYTPWWGVGLIRSHGNKSRVIGVELPFIIVWFIPKRKQ